MRNGYWSVRLPVPRRRAAHDRARARPHRERVARSRLPRHLRLHGYSAAKFAVMGFTEALRFEMKPARRQRARACARPTPTRPALAFEKTLRPHETDVIAGNIKADPAREGRRGDRARRRDAAATYIIPDALSAFYFRLKGLLPELFFAIVDGDVEEGAASSVWRRARHEPAAERE